MRKIILILTIVFISAGLFAVSPNNFGISILSTRAENGLSVYEAENRDGYRFSIALKGEPDDSQIKLAHLVEDTFFYWKNLNIESLKIVFENGKASVIIVPAELMYGSVNLSEYLPAGIQFYYDTFFEYDFRMYVDNLFLRLKGQLLSEDELIKKIYEASINPILFLQTQDPAYIVRQIMAINENISAFAEAEEAEREEAIEELISLNTELKKLTSDYNSLKTDFDALTASHTELTAKHNELTTKNSELTAEHQKLAEKHDALSGGVSTSDENQEKLIAEFDLVRYALIGLSNKGFFGILKPFSTETIESILAIKTANPSFTSAEIAQSIKDSGGKADKNLIKLILAVYHNDFEQD